MSSSSFSELASRQSGPVSPMSPVPPVPPVPEDRREVTAVSIPGRFLPPAGAAESPAERVVVDPEEPSAEIAAAVHRLVASTDDAALGLTGFRWELDEEPAAPQVRLAVAVPEDMTPLPMPALPAADTAAELLDAEFALRESASTTTKAAEKAPLDFSFAPVAAEPVTREIIPALPPISAAMPVPLQVESLTSQVVQSAESPLLLAGEKDQLESGLAAPSEAVLIPSEAAPILSEAVPILSEVVPLPSEAVLIASEAAPKLSEVALIPGEATPQLSEAAPIPGETIPRSSEVESVATTTASLVLVTSISAPMIPAPDEPAWAPVGFSPAMIESKGPSISSIAAPARSMATPTPLPPPATSAPPLLKATTAAAESPPSGARQAAVGVWLRRAGQTLRSGAQWLQSTGQTLARAGILRLRAFWAKVRSAAAQLESRLTWPVDLRTSIPWLGGAALLLIVVLFTAYSCGVRTKQRNLRPRSAASATQPLPAPASQAGDVVLPQDAR